ncbi:DCL1_1 [Sanghuangporus sanghuang]
MPCADEYLKLFPRKYQEEIFEQARNENVIAALETGSGKTLIAALLVKWVMAQPSLVGKKAIFLVPKVPLVDQQRSFLSEQTPLVVRGYTGAMGVEAWNKGRWDLEFTQSDCLVMTAQIFKDILVHGYWTMDRVSLLIFDECHHAQKNHPYRMIMTDFYASCREKPKVFGMTASPVWNSKKPEASIRDLQKNMSAKVIAVREHAESLGQHVNRPVEIIATFSSAAGDRYVTYYKPTLWERLQSDDLVTMKQLNVEGFRRRQEYTLESAGPAGADYFVLMHAKKVVEDYASPQAAVVYSISSSPGRRKSITKKNSIITELPAQLENLRQVVSTFEQRLLLDKRPFPPDWISPKLQATVDILAKHRSETFQGIIFVSQRQLAVTLSWILSRLPETKDWVRCGELTGHGDSSAVYSEGAKGMGLSAQREVVQSFKNKKLNLLITTSVGEEGLDFPACELVIRYDSAQHMVGYVQSRGRARQQQSTFVVLINENDLTEIARYQTFQRTEPELKAVYRSMNSPTSSTDMDPEDASEAIEDDPQDLATRESYTIPSTGATLTYSSAIQLLNHLCSLIPRDAYTTAMRPKYSGDFAATLRLPRALPLPGDKLTFRGPLKRTKREAKRAVAFMAVRELHLLGVFDDHFSPIVAQKGECILDADGRPISKVSDVAVMMDVMVASPWKSGPPWYLHSLCIDGVARAGIVCGNVLPEVDVTVRGKHVQTRHSSALLLNLAPSQVDILDRFTKMGIWWCITASPIGLPMACYLVPLNSFEAIDWPGIEKVVVDERGSADWSGVTEEHRGQILVMNWRRTGRPLRFICIRHDISLYDRPHLEDTLQSCDNYIDYFECVYPIRAKSPENSAHFPPPSGRIFEVQRLSRYRSSSYDLDAFKTHETQLGRIHEEEPPGSLLVPESFCRWVALDKDIVDAFQVFAPVCQRICDIFRARIARRYLKYPPIPDNLMIEALTLPCAMENFNNQRLETIGDSVLKLSVVVYTFNHFPTKHEGQLTALKSNSVSNRLLLARAKEAHLERFLSCEPRNLRTWSFFMPAKKDSGTCVMDGEEVALARRSFPRRSLQDCMEASLGAAYMTGGIEMALQTGAALGLCFGGPIPWPVRYPCSETIPPAAIFCKLQKDLQYTFRNGNLLVEAVKHPSFDSNEGGSCYQRLEYLGDAVIELVVTTYLYNKFPEATSGQMTWSRARAICNATLAALAVKRLSLHKYILVNNVELSADIKNEVELLTVSPYEDVAINDWKYDPPKALADIFESVIGAVFVDCGSSYPTIVPIVERVMKDVLQLLHPNMPRDPVTRLLEFVTKAGCIKANFRKERSDPNVRRKDSVVVTVHGQIVAGPIVSSNKPLAKGLVAEAAMSLLKDDSSEFALCKICTCMSAEDDEETSDLPERNMREKDINVETTEGFAVAGRLRLGEVEEEANEGDAVATDEDTEELERQEVEMLLGAPGTPTSVASDLSRKRTILSLP